MPTETHAMTSPDWNEAEKQDLYDLIDAQHQGHTTLEQVLDALAEEGIRADDPRLGRFIREQRGRRANGEITHQSRIEREVCQNFIAQHKVVRDALAKQLIIPDFKAFREELTRIYHEVAPLTLGKVADYIPQLARMNPEHFAISVCTIDGQRFSLGHSDERFCLQSTCKPINYALAVDEHGTEVVHRHVGREPSGRSFNELSLNDEGLPHNPLINSGAIMCASLLQPQAPLADRYDYVRDTWTRLCAEQPVAFNNSVYLSERETADRNFALAYFMRENQAFPPHTHLQQTLELYFQSCSIESCTDHLSVAAATLANGGINPLTGEQIFRNKTVQHTLSLMLTCGMYDFSGEFAFKTGLPAKSGVSGALFVVIPNVMGLSIWSPALDEHGNSVRGVAFCEKLIEAYSFHPYDSLLRQTKKKNPRLGKYESTFSRVVNLIWAASQGDLDEIKRLHAGGVDLRLADYDGRTALHLAATENHPEVVDYLIEQGVPLAPEDRWGGTPLADAEKAGHKAVAQKLRQALAASADRA